MNGSMQRKTADLQEVLGNMTEFHTQVEAVINCLQNAFSTEKRLYTAGNGGSAAEAQHLAEEFIGRYHSNRKSYPAIALTSDGTVLTCIGNDFGFEHIFSRQIEGLGQEGDVLVVLSTSGNSENLVEAVKTAKQKGMITVGFLGQGGELMKLVDLLVSVPSVDGARVQELHLHAIHLICDAFE